MPVDARPTPEIFRLAVGASPSGMIAVNGDGTIIMINGEIERLFGYLCQRIARRSPALRLRPRRVGSARLAQEAEERCCYRSLTKTPELISERPPRGGLSLCAEHDRQLGGVSPLSNLMVVKD
jgi:PAS domain-containing protein